jgi:hypothetical protein
VKAREGAVDDRALVSDPRRYPGHLEHGLGDQRMTSKKSAATRSAAERLLVGCPLPDAVVARIECIRSRVARSRTPVRSVFVSIRYTFLRPD